ncbi:hypothetical protein IHQ71_30835 (plasmid) [Rhizobium sp. TH2]|uniref:hypothetical protein n=1 Tax=Rhizobium sp. TH2 TaxID=2775403 RepID=UPI0021583EFC|nr:hypothetical protein [Rhizobium sp. TH2]UVC12400.1 hypothetical protein IHQ71_30835 [Rhizobium sp. TH2]
MSTNHRIIKVLDLIEEDIIGIMATANAAGYSSEEVLTALELIVKNARIALEEDPDPADDPPN